MSKMLGLSSPWVNYYHELLAMFGSDDDIKIVFEEDEYTIRLYVDDIYKAECLSRIIPEFRAFGGVTVKNVIIPANGAFVNKEKKLSKEEIFEGAFLGNPVLEYTKIVDWVFSNPIVFVVFKNEVVQYFNDNIFDAHGVCSTLYESIANDLFVNTEGVYFCTDTKDRVTFGPTKEWP